MNSFSLLFIVLIVTAHLSLAAYPVRYATKSPDIKSFTDKHQDEGAIILFTDLSSSESGIFDGIFNLFLDSSFNFEIDVENSLADKFPTMKVDLSKKSLKSTKEEYKVEEDSYIVVYYKGQEIYRGEPDMDTTEELVKLIKEKNVSEPVKNSNSTNTEPPKNETKVEPKTVQKESSTHNHSDALVLTPDYGHLSLSESSSNTTQKTKSENTEQKTIPVTIIPPVSQEINIVNSLSQVENQKTNVALNQQPMSNQVPKIAQTVTQNYPTGQSYPSSQTYPISQGHPISQGNSAQSYSSMPGRIMNPNQQAIQPHYQSTSQQSPSGFIPQRASQPQISTAAKTMIGQRIPRNSIRSFIGSRMQRRF